jgi:hypothetical protein
MTQDQENIRTMFQTTLAFLDSNNSLWSGRTAFADAVNRARAGVEQIDTAADIDRAATRPASLNCAFWGSSCAAKLCAPQLRSDSRKIVFVA